jgi:hypothetical protein
LSTEPGSPKEPFDTCNDKEQDQEPQLEQQEPQHENHTSQGETFPSEEEEQTSVHEGKILIF